MLIHTRYVGSNIALLLVGAVVCLFTGFMAVMTAGFGADPVHDFRSGAILCDILATLLSVPFYLAMFRWCGVGNVGYGALRCLVFWFVWLAEWLDPPSCSLSFLYYRD
jgi:hypothetical protein